MREIAWNIGQVTFVALIDLICSLGRRGGEEVGVKKFGCRQQQTMPLTN